MWETKLIYILILSFARPIIPISLANITTLTSLTATDGTKSFLGGLDTIIDALNLINPTTTNSSQLIKMNGYQVEEHTVCSGNYILIIFRIPGKVQGTTKPIPVMLYHGFISSSDDFLVQGKNSLPFLLADQGYDVWLGNARGNTYGRKHTSLSPTNPLFWDFSWHDIGVEDVPATIDYICKTAGVSKILYIGHSQGTAVLYVMLSKKPDYNNKLLGCVSLASIAYISNAKSPVLQVLATLSVGIALKALNINELFPHRPPITSLTFLLSSSKFLRYLYLTVVYSLYGYDYDQIDDANQKEKNCHQPGGSSLKTLVHFLQLVISKRFAEYDYGVNENIVVYGLATPPSYEIENISTNLTIFYGENDWLSDFNGDVTRFILGLPITPVVIKVASPCFNHIDFLWAKDAVPLLYNQVLETLKIYSS